MRLFVAVDLDECKDLVIEVQKQLVATGLRISFPSSFHVTLQFLGEVPESQVPSIISALETVKYKSFTLTMMEIGCFPSKNDPAIVWLGLQPSIGLDKLKNAVDSALKWKKPDDHPFVPHITIGRIRQLGNAEQIVFSRLIEKVSIPSQKIQVDKFHVYKSDLSTGKPVYSIINSFSASKHK